MYALGILHQPFAGTEPIWGVSIPGYKAFSGIEVHIVMAVSCCLSNIVSIPGYKAFSGIEVQYVS